jgi:hypothetical protein
MMRVKLYWLLGAKVAQAVNIGETTSIAALDDGLDSLYQSLIECFDCHFSTSE